MTLWGTSGRGEDEQPAGFLDFDQRRGVILERRAAAEPPWDWMALPIVLPRGGLSFAAGIFPFQIRFFLRQQRHLGSGMGGRVRSKGCMAQRRDGG